MSVELQPGVIPLFAYGTLQPGEALYGLVEEDLLGAPVASVLFGYKCYENKNNSFPYLMKADTNDYTFGTLLPLPYGDSWEYVARMEMSAGYEVQKVTAYVSREDAEAGLIPVIGVAFVLPEKKRSWVGREVADHMWQPNYVENNQK